MAVLFFWGIQSLSGQNNTSKKEAELKAFELLDLLGLKERAQHKPSELSGGEQQRVAFARLFLSGKKFAILDEATSALDSENEDKMYSFLKNSALLVLQWVRS